MSSGIKAESNGHTGKAKSAKQAAREAFDARASHRIAAEPVDVPQEPVDPYVPFPTELLPPAMRRFLEEGERAMQCDCAFFALPLITAAGAAIGNTAQVMAKSGYVQKANLWTAPVGTSGVLKTPSQKASLAPVYKFQLSRLQEHNGAMADYKAEMSRFDAMPKKDRADAVEPSEPSLMHVVTIDSTVEGLVKLSQKSPRGVLVALDELASLWGSFNQYKKGGGNDREAYLSMYDSSLIKKDRQGSGSVIVPAMFVAITGGIQPSRLSAILNDTEIDSGMAARFLFAMPPPRSQRWSENTISEEASADISSMFERLYLLPMELDDSGRAIARTLPLSDDAKALFADWYNEVGDELDGTAGEEGGYPLALSKLRSVPLRLSLMLQGVSHVTTEQNASFTHVDATSMRRGIALGRWFRDEQKRVYARLLMSKDRRRLSGIIDLIVELGGSVSVRDWMRKRNLHKSEIARGELQLVVDARLGQWKLSQPATGGHTVETLILCKEGGSDESTPAL